MKTSDSYYDSIAKGYNELHGEEQEKKLEIIGNYIDSNNLLESVKNVLDVGCGTGIAADFFAKKGIETFGIDPSKELIKNNSNSNKLSILKAAPAEDIPFRENEFDLVVSLTAIQNFEDLNKGLEEIKRVGKTKFILTFLNKVKKTEEIDRTIKSKFKIKHIEVGKDRIYFIH